MFLAGLYPETVIAELSLVPVLEASEGTYFAPRPESITFKVSNNTARSKGTDKCLM